MEYDDEKSDCRQKRKVEQKVMVIRPFTDSFARAADYGTYRLLKKRVEYATIAKLISCYWKKHDVRMTNVSSSVGIRPFFGICRQIQGHL